MLRCRVPAKYREVLPTRRLARGSLFLMLCGITIPYCYDNDFNYYQ